MYQPITISTYTFENTISGNYLYVDKTDYFHRLVREQNGIFFLSPPSPVWQIAFRIHPEKYFQR